MRLTWNLLIVVALGAGCSGPVQPVVEIHHDAEQARVALISALDAWKKGEARGLAQRKPPIRFADDDLAMGLRLFDYALEEPDAPITPHKNVPVILSLRDARGKAIRREAHYQVSTEPALAVLRSDR